MTQSYSGIASFDGYPYRWFLSYLCRDEDGCSLKKEGGFFTEFRSYMHKILQTYLSGLLEKERLSIYYATHFKENVFSKAPSSKIYMNYFQQGFHYLDGFSFPSRTIIDVEEKVDFMLAGGKFTGFVGPISKNGKLIITDHKSRTLKPRLKRSKPTKYSVELDEHLRQLYVYSAAVKGKYGRYPNILEFNYFRPQVMTQGPFGLKRLYTVENWASRAINSTATNGEWNTKPDYQKCSYLCDVCNHYEYKRLTRQG